MAQAQRSVVVNVPPEKLLAVIGDFDSYPEFLPEVKKVSVLKRDGASAEVAYEIDVIKRVEYTLRHTVDGNTVRWTLVRSNLLKKNEGSWVLEPHGDNATLATYSLELAFGGFIPVPASVTTKLAETSLPALLENYKRRAESLYGSGNS